MSIKLIMSHLVRLEDGRILEDFDGMENAQNLLKNSNMDLLTKVRKYNDNKVVTKLLQ